MRLLVTGAAGFIGFHLSEKLSQTGHNVLGIDNLSEYYDINLKNKRISILENEAVRNSDFRFKFLKLDLKIPSDLDEVFLNFRPDAVFHLAAQAGVRYSVSNPIESINENIIITTNLLECCKKHKVRNFFYASSSSVYGLNKSPPFSESDVIDTPLSVYAASKRSCELICHVYNTMYGINVNIFRFFTVYGPWGRPDMAIYKFCESISNNAPIEVYNYGDHLRDFTFVSDIVDGLVLSLKASGGYQIFNLGSDNPVNLKKLIEMIESRMGRTTEKEYLPMQKGDVHTTHANIEKARNELGYNPQVPIEEGLDLFVKWYTDYKK